jgi:hypothetical protein
MSLKVFVSHASGDLPIVRAFVELLECIVRDPTDIFCSSVPSHRTPLGLDYKEHLKSRLGETDLVVALVTPRYSSSAFCMNELGAAWVLAKRLIPLLVPPVTAAAIAGSLLSDHQSAYLNDASALDEIRDTVGGGASTPSWNQHRARFLEQVKAITIDTPALDGVPTTRFAQSDSREFFNTIEPFLLKATRLAFLGIGVNVLKNRPLVDALIERVRAGLCTLTIYLADLASPSIESRQSEEELLRPRPHPAGVDTERFIDYMRHQAKLEGLTIKLFTHYPTYALIVVDEHYFVYPYGFATLGNYCPVTWYRSTDPHDVPVTSFYDAQLRMIDEFSVPPDKGLRRARAAGIRSHSSTDTVGLAVFLIPPEGSPLYQFGTEVIGYDIRRGCSVPAILSAEESGEAATFGFHLTVCDALFFATTSEARKVRVEVAVRARQFRRFRLSRCRVRPEVPDHRSVALVPDELSGTLEMLHCELVHIVYRRAIASNYTLKPHETPRDQRGERNATVTQRYLAPYILGSYKPHFTLATNVAKDRLGVRAAELTRHLQSSMTSNQSVDIGSLCIMGKTAGRWEIVEEIDLGE